MRKLLLTSTFIIISIAIFGQRKMNNNSTSMDTLSYALGIVFGENIKSGGFENVDANVFAQTVDKVLKGEPLLFSKEQASEVINTAYRKNIERKAQKNLEKGKAFLDENAKKEGVITLASGLQYKVLTEGTGAKPTLSDKVKVHYHGTLIDGTVFDSSVERGEPISFGVTQVIKGWTEALLLMPIGSKWMLYIPADLAYGANPRPGGVIEPNDALIFEVELLGIE